MKHMHQGFSLTELLVCFFLSMLLIAILLQHVLSVSRTHQHIHDVLDEATELQWVFDVMRARIHHAGFTPCLGLNQLQTTDTRDSSESLQAIEVQAGTHLLIRKMDEAHFGLARRLTPDTLRVRDFGLKPDRPVIIADCVHAEVHDVESFYHTSEGLLIQLKTPLVFDYSSEIYLGEWISESFFFRKPRGLFIKQQRVDTMAQAKSIQFRLEHHTEYDLLCMDWISNLGKEYHFSARTRM